MNSNAKSNICPQNIRPLYTRRFTRDTSILCLFIVSIVIHIYKKFPVCTYLNRITRFKLKQRMLEVCCDAALHRGIMFERLNNAKQSINKPMKSHYAIQTALHMSLSQHSFIFIKKNVLLDTWQI